MKRIILILIFLCLILPVSASGDDYFQDWVDNYYESGKVSDDKLNDLFKEYATEESMDRTDFEQLDFVYKNVYGRYNDSKIQKYMNKDFKKGDKNHDGELSFKEFKKIFKKIYSYSCDSPSAYAFFKDCDGNNDSKIDFGEFSDISYIFTKDSFWDGYSIEEILDTEWYCASSDGDDYLDYHEFKNALGY